MNDLTDKWKKGELPEWFYWIEFQDGKIIPTTFSNQHGFICCDVICYEEKIRQILAVMPSYEEWKSTGKFAMEAMKVAEENTKLKELLKRARGLMNYTKDWACRDATEEMIAKIDNAIGEKK